MNAAKLVCVIDDDDFARLQICAALLFKGFPTIQGRDGDAGLNALRNASEAVSVVIVDVLMPNKDGFETILELKALYPSLKIIAVSGDGARQSANELLLIARDLGADVCLRKPVVMDRIVDEVVALSKVA